MLVVQAVMKRRGIDHETYQRIQTEIDTVFKHVRRTYSQAKGAYEVMDTQQRVMALLNLPSFLEEKRQADRAGTKRMPAFAIKCQNHFEWTEALCG
jgi:acyl-[acyl carrier protein]--UDP-N-acetylglucosamine O-acyltransferase